jgi:hypothetical protein
LRTIDDVVRLGRLKQVEPTRLVQSEGEAATANDAGSCIAPHLG